MDLFNPFQEETYPDISGSESPSTTTTLPDWHAPGLSDHIDPASLISDKPVTAMAGAGDTLVIYRGLNGSEWSLYKSEKRSGVWTHASDQNSYFNPPGSSADTPSVAMSDSGSSIIAWHQKNASNYDQIFISTRDSGTWTHPADLSDNISPDNTNASKPACAADNNGNRIVVWQQMNGGNTDIYMSEYRNGSWTHPSSFAKNINPASAGDASNPRVTMDHAGNAYIIWEQSDGTDKNIYLSEYHNGSWTHPSAISAFINPDHPSANDCSNPVISASSSGLVTAGWIQKDSAGHSQVFIAQFNGTSWSYPAGIHDFVSSSAENSFQLDIRQSDNPVVTLAWIETSGSVYRVRIKDFRNSTWNSFFASPAGSTSYLPVIAMNQTGQTLVTWYGFDSSNRHQVFKADCFSANWSLPSSGDDNISPDGYSCSYPSAAMDSHGNAVISWLENNHIYIAEKR
jgi:hypothetical protein